VNPAVIRKHPPDVIAVALLMDKHPDEVGGWNQRDRNWLLTRAEANEHLK
jgi:hypothetical protein